MASVPTSGSAAATAARLGRPSGRHAGQSRYGGFWIRVVAYIIDAILLAVVCGVVDVGCSASDILGTPDWRSLTIRSANLSRLARSAGSISPCSESSERGATVGKMAMGLRVVTSEGQRLSFLNATGRYFAKIHLGHHPAASASS